MDESAPAQFQPCSKERAADRPTGFFWKRSIRRLGRDGSLIADLANGAASYSYSSSSGATHGIDSVGMR